VRWRETSNEMEGDGGRRAMNENAMSNNDNQQERERVERECVCMRA
jgi:hypothetical protein